MTTKHTSRAIPWGSSSKLETDFVFSIERAIQVKGKVLWFASCDQNHIIYSKDWNILLQAFINE